MSRKRKRKKTARSPIRRAFKIIYRTVVALSAVVVVLFCAYKLLSKPPSMADGPVHTPPLVDTQAPQEQEGERDPDGQVSSAPQRRENTYTFLLAASDQAGSNADTIMVCTYDTVNQRVGLVSVPRDTLVREGKINSLYHKGVDSLKNAVSDMLGIPIDHYITVNIRGFVEIIDAVGGIEFNVPVHMSYDDPTQDLHIHFEPGLQHLTGQEALEVARCRKNSDGSGTYPNNVYDAYPDADIGRTRTQQQLITTVLKKILSSPDRISKVVSTLMEYVDTDLTLSNLLWLAEPALKLDFSSGLSTATLEGNGNTYYPGWGRYCYQLYPEQALEVVNTMLNPYDRDLTLADMNIFQYQ